MDINSINIFILAAGQGERLRPITNHIPKPLMPILGKPALQRVLERVSALPFKGIGINTYYMKEAIGEWAAQSTFKDSITLFEEDTVIGTGGALKNAEGFLSDSAFLVHNSDVLSDIDLNKLLEHHNESENLVTLALHDYPKFNTVVIDENGLLNNISKDRPDKGSIVMAFTGIAVYEPGFLKFLPEGESSVVDAWLKAVYAGERIGMFDVTGQYWTDIGTPFAYAAAVFNMLREDGETLYVDPTVKSCEASDMQGYVVIESGCDMRGIVSLSNCILLPGCNAGAFAYSKHKDYIMGPGFRVLLEEAEMFDLDEEGRQLIGTGGSDRRYYRIKERNDTSVLMQCKEYDPDYESHLEYSRFFMKQGVPVPQLIIAEPENRQAVFEDAGDMSLYNWLKCPRSGKEKEKIYRKAIDAVVMMHKIKDKDMSKCVLLKERVFDYDYFRWETDYFMERFVKGLWDIKIDNVSVLEKELDMLAVKADTLPKNVIHRDLQSQNIMVMKDELRLVDFQGARIGPAAYDIASILWDPYHCLDDALRDRLIEYYVECMMDAGGFDEGSFRESLVTCRLQRHMQALGAYGFLSRVKGKKYFLKYVPEGLRLLKEDVDLCMDNYPVLKKFIMDL
ncbi:MAG: phosphotransferase [Nitrospira sp.]|nr:phosphotransferase [Nitrospira sp.]